jgi:hypothetical protein
LQMRSLQSGNDQIGEEYFLETVLFSFEIITVYVGFEVLTAVL